MSAVVMEQPVIVGGVGRAEPTDNAKRLASDSAVRWVIQFYKDIDFMGPTGREVKNTIQPEIEIDGDEKRLVFCGMRRCTPYPLMNHEYNVAPHEQVGFDGPPSYGAWGMNEGLATQPINAPKYARQCADELAFRYAAEFGFMTLEPLTGADTDVVRDVFAVLQPMAYKIHNLEQELTTGASIRAAEMDDKTVTINGQKRQLSEVCEATRRLMLIGARRAMTTAREHYGDFERDARAYIGSKKGRHSPEDYDRFVADQLGLAVPTVIQSAPQANDSAITELLTKLTEKATEKVDDGTAQRLAELEAQATADREERRLLMKKLDALTTKPVEEVKAKK